MFPKRVLPALRESRSLGGIWFSGGKPRLVQALLAIRDGLLVGGNISARGIYNNLNLSPAGAGVRLTLLTNSECL